MIHFFTGTPRSGKSLHMAMVIDQQLRKGKNVIANFEINERTYKRFNKKHPGKLGKFIYVPNKQWLNNAYYKRYDERRSCFADSPSDSFSYLDGLYGYALNFHKRNSRGQIIEGQTLLVLDECQGLFNPRSWNRKDRLDWCSFFREHGKYGYEVYLISQDESVLDKQIRHVIQFEYIHRCVNNYRLTGKILGFMVGGRLFVYVQKMKGVKAKDATVKTKFFSGQQKYYEFYDSYQTFGRESAAAIAAADN